MSRFNLAGWAIRHPQLIAFLILVIGLAGAFAYSGSAGPKIPPSHQVRRGHRRMAGRDHDEMQSQVADRIEKKLEGAALDRQDRHLLQTLFHRDFADLSRLDALARSPAPVLAVAQEDGRRSSRPTGGVIGPLINDDFDDVDLVLYTIVGDGASYAQLKDVAEAFPTSAARSRRHQGRPLRRPGRSAFSSSSATPSSRLSACR